MSQDLTQNLPDSFQERVLAEFAGLNNRMTSLEGGLTSLAGRMTSLEDRVLSVDSRLISLEDKVDARLRETRPILGRRAAAFNGDRKGTKHSQPPLQDDD